MTASSISLCPIPAPAKLRAAIHAQLSATAGIALSDAQKIEKLFCKNKGTKPPMDRAFLLADDGKTLHVQVFGQFDLHSNGLICDRVLGTIGILQAIPTLPSRPTDKNLEELREWFRQRIDEATYLRHLLVEVTREDGREPHAQPYTVELVFIPFDESVASIPLAGEILRPLMRETTFLHAIGVNLWRYPLESPGQQRRAFSWLMNDTRRWLAGQHNKNGVPARSLAGITLEHFRLAGKRDLRLVKNQILHLVHGHNGSGKSSIVEALELAVTGKVERIEERRRHPGEQATYREILTNRNAGKSSSAKMTLHWTPETGRNGTTSLVTEEGVAKPLKEALKAGAFRMDQRFADRLAAGSPAERARVFMETFFADQNAQISKWLAARAKFDECVRQLPEAERVALAQSSSIASAVEADPKIAVRDLGWVAGEEIPWARVRGYVRLDEETLTTLAPLFPKKLVSQLREKSVLTSTRMAGMAKEVDEALERQRTRAAQHRQTFSAAAAVLEALSAHTIAKQAASDRSLPELMNDWLELHAITDLLEKEHVVLSTIEAAREASYVFHGERTPTLADRKRSGAGTSRETTLARLRKECGEARRLLSGTASSTERAAKAKQGGAANALPATLDFAALDEVARLGAFGEEFASCEPPLGHAVRIAFHEHRLVEVHAGNRTLRVGEKGWGDEIRSRLQRISAALEAFAPTISGSRVMPLATLFPLLQQTHVAAKELLVMDRKVVDDFAQLVGNGGPFSVAINEFMALLTPARWAYEDLTPQVSLKHGAQEFEFAVNKIPAQLRLNTAELNSLALGFFLLCARQVAANPLRLLILDDPLQNMDEFTVTTVARGLCKLLRMWQTMDDGTAKGAAGRGWQILLLLHGEEDVERVRSEAPCTIYYLPWLSPDERSTGVTAPKIESEHSWMQRELQRLENTFAQIA